MGTVDIALKGEWFIPRQKVRWTLLFEWGTYIKAWNMSMVFFYNTELTYCILKGKPRWTYTFHSCFIPCKCYKKRNTIPSIRFNGIFGKPIVQLFVSYVFNSKSLTDLVSLLWSFLRLLLSKLQHENDNFLLLWYQQELELVILVQTQFTQYLVFLIRFLA